MTDGPSGGNPARGGPQPPNNPAYGDPIYPQGDYRQVYGPYPPGAYGQPPYPPPYGYPGYGYPGYGYPPVAPGDRRPSTVLASAVLGYVCASLLILAGGMCFIGASAFESIYDDFGVRYHQYTVELVLAGLINLIAAGLLIAGGVAMSNRNANGRVIYSVGAALVIVAAVYWLAEWATKYGLSGLSMYAIVFGALVIVGAALVFTGAGSKWLTADQHT